MSKSDVCRICLIFLAHGILASLSLAMVCLPSLFIFPFTGHGMFAVFVNLPFPWPWDVCCLCSFAHFLGHGMFAGFVHFSLSLAMGCLLALFMNLSLAMGCLLSLFICPLLGHGTFAGFVHCPFLGHGMFAGFVQFPFP